MLNTSPTATLHDMTVTISRWKWRWLQGIWWYIIQ